MSLVEVTFTIPNRTISALTNGKTDKPLLLMVHGWLDNAASFSKLIPMLDDYHVVAIDLPGHGKSSHRSPDAHYHLLDYVHDLHCLVDSQKWQDFAIVGHSLGGIISSMYCSVFPELVRKFVCIESAGPLCGPESTSVNQLKKAIESRIKANEKPIKQPTSIHSIVEARQKVSDLSAESATLIMQRNVSLSDGQNNISWSTDKRLRTISSLRLTHGQVENLMQGLDCPIHFVLGSTGFSKVKDLMESRKPWFKDFQVTTVNGGHHCHMEAVEEISQIINKHCV
ncbi:MAG: pimeloyl-ACP methyl ester carboxylesterase [Glaciecola sp.]|jgi:pimeloyl-ACP methyl ester carboxylesterase